VRTAARPVAILLVAASMLVLGALRPQSSERTEQQATRPLGTGATLATTSSGPADDLGALRARVAADPEDGAARAALGLAYLRQATATAAPARLTKAEGEFTKALAGGGRGRLDALVGMASLANARHDFRASARWARRAIASDPHAAAPYGLLGDALFQLGDHRGADMAYEEMVTLRPDVGSYLRIGYARSFRGDVPGAKEAMKLALQAAGPIGESAAFVRHQMGDIYLGLAQWKQARQENRIGTRLAPGYVPPRVGIAEAEFGLGHVDRAIAIMEDAVRDLPSIEYEITLGDLYAVGGRSRAADARWRRVARRIATYRAHGMQPDVDLITFDVDHGFRLDEVLAEARAVYADRPTPAAADALAWALHAHGKNRQAWRFAQKSLEGPAAAPSHLVHAAEIASALGRKHLSGRYLAEARAQGAFFDPSILAARVE
jgi:tetratricopeptide (TPR) repeat protein